MYIISENLNIGDKISVINCMGKCEAKLIVKIINKGEEREVICPSCGTKHSVKLFKSGKCRIKNLSC